MKPERLIHGSTAILHQVTADDAVIAPAEAAKRGWVRQEDVGYRLSGAEASARLLPLLSQLGSLYNKGAKTTIDVLDLADLEVEGGGRLAAFPAGRDAGRDEAVGRAVRSACRGRQTRQGHDRRVRGRRARR